MTDIFCPRRTSNSSASHVLITVKLDGAYGRGVRSLAVSASRLAAIGKAAHTSVSKAECIVRTGLAALGIETTPAQRSELYRTVGSTVAGESADNFERGAETLLTELATMGLAPTLEAPAVSPQSPKLAVVPPAAPAAPMFRPSDADIDEAAQEFVRATGESMSRATVRALARVGVLFPSAFVVGAPQAESDAERQTYMRDLCRVAGVPFPAAYAPANSAATTSKALRALAAAGLLPESVVTSAADRFSVYNAETGRRFMHHVLAAYPNGVPYKPLPLPKPAEPTKPLDLEEAVRRAREVGAYVGGYPSIAGFWALAAAELVPADVVSRAGARDGRSIAAWLASGFGKFAPTGLANATGSGVAVEVLERLGALPVGAGALERGVTDSGAGCGATYCEGLVRAVWALKHTPAKAAPETAKGAPTEAQLDALAKANVPRACDTARDAIFALYGVKGTALTDAERRGVHHAYHAGLSSGHHGAAGERAAINNVVAKLRELGKLPAAPGRAVPTGRELAEFAKTFKVSDGVPAPPVPQPVDADVEAVLASHPGYGSGARSATDAVVARLAPFAADNVRLRDLAYNAWAREHGWRPGIVAAVAAVRKALETAKGVTLPAERLERAANEIAAACGARYSRAMRTALRIVGLVPPEGVEAARSFGKRSVAGSRTQTGDTVREYEAAGILPEGSMKVDNATLYGDTTVTSARKALEGIAALMPADFVLYPEPPTPKAAEPAPTPVSPAKAPRRYWLQRVGGAAVLRSGGGAPFVLFKTRARAERYAVKMAAKGKPCTVEVFDAAKYLSLPVELAPLNADVTTWL
jgi:hypothetical protein